MSDKLDLIVFGATGFTGKCAVEEIIRITKTDKNLTWGIAGRSQNKLEKTLKDLEDKTGEDLSSIKTFTAEVSDSESLKAMCRNAKVIVNCCGPYLTFGEPVVKACIETGTHHVDISGESVHMETIQLQYNEAAQNAGVYIITACGFDSVPADLGVVFLSQQFKGQLNSAESYMSFSMEGYTRPSGEAVAHFGTWESVVHGVNQDKDLRPIRAKLFQSKLPDLKPKLKSRSLIHRSQVDQKLHIPFPGADQSVVYRTQRFFYETNNKRPIQMNPYFGSNGYIILMRLLTIGAMLTIMSLTNWGKNLLLKHPKFFSLGYCSHEGPSEESMKATRFEFNIVGTGWDESVNDFENVKPNKKMHIRVTGKNPVYGTTTTSLIFSAITIVRESDKIPGKGGVLTPGAAFAKTSFISNLNKNNLTFKVISED